MPVGYGYKREDIHTCVERETSEDEYEECGGEEAPGEDELVDTQAYLRIRE